MSLYNDFQQAFSVTGPILIVLLIGIGLRQVHFLNREFVIIGNKLVFNLALPCLLFLSAATTNIASSVNFTLIIFAAITTVTIVVVVWLLAGALVASNKRGAFTQCCFRGNMGIIGLSLCVNAFGPQILAKAGIYVALMTILYNVLSVILLTRSRASMLLNIIKNPLIIGIVAGLVWSATAWPLPQVAAVAAGYFAQMTLPLALLCIGASLDWSSLKINHRDVLIAAALKIVFIPLFVSIVAIFWGLKGEDLGVLFLMMAAPTAAAAYVMTKQMTVHGAMAAEIITLTSILSPLSVTVGLMILNNYKFI